MVKPLILLSNDDGVSASGLKALITMLSPLGDLFVIAPDKSRSGASHSLTVSDTVKVAKIKESENLSIYSCSGTPADCVKLATSCLLPHLPDLMISGINHGSNSSVSVIYSGTMGAAIEASMLGIPAIGFSLCDHSLDADFSASIKYGRIIVEKLLNIGMPNNISLNINIPPLPQDKIKGIKICRQNKGMWDENFEKETDPLTGEETYRLSGYYLNEEPEAEGTDETALKNGYISVVPVHFDLTAYSNMEQMKYMETFFN
ncbi:MAG: 5'/3'-nucleotidase SurE [Prevotellaceae bacterium]|jgi:5'-nucleotidase|nr:5'/3'-nucleotidase SurE [Prevotellaceae bacterium]